MQLFQSETGELSQLFSQENRIYLQTRPAEGPTRAALLAEDCRHFLEGVIFQKELYYAYLSDDVTLTLRALHKSEPLCRLQTVTVPGFSPRLFLFQERMLVIYGVSGPDGVIRLLISQPLSEEPPLALPCPVTASTDVSMAESEKAIYFILSAEDQHMLFQLTADLLLTASPTVRETRLSDETELLRRQLDSAKQQYAELQHTAECYREEARKWYQTYLYHK